MGHGDWEGASGRGLERDFRPAHVIAHLWGPAKAVMPCSRIFWHQGEALGSSGRIGFLASILLAFCQAAAQSGVNSACSVAMPDLSSTAPNIFNDRQEQDLGDALA